MANDIFSNIQSGQPASPGGVATPFVPDEDDGFLDEISKDFERLQKQKARPTGGVEIRILTSCAFTWGEQYISQQSRGIVAEPKDANKLYLVFNVIDHRLGKLLGRLSSIAPLFKARPDKKDPKAQSEAEVVDRLIGALDEKLDQPSVTWDILWWMAVGGVAFEYVPWIPDDTVEPMPQYDEMSGELLFKGPGGQTLPESAVEQQIAAGAPKEAFEILQILQRTGEVGSIVLSPLQVFLDQSVKSIDKLAPDQAVYIAFIKTLGWIKENYEETGANLEEGADELKIVTTSFFQEGDTSASLFLKDMIPMLQGTCSEDDPDMYVVVERYQPASKSFPEGRFTCFIPKLKILYDGNNPYEEIPLVDFHWKPVTTTFWTKDYVTDLIAPQRFLNKRLSQLGEQANASIYDKILLGGTLSEVDIPVDYPGIIKNALGEAGEPFVQRLPGPQLPGWFLESINVVSKMFNDIAGGSDLFQESKFTGQMRGPMAVPMLQEILDSEWGPLYQHIGQRMARVKNMRLNRVKKFYPPLRTMHYTDKDQRDEVMTFHTEEVLKSGTNYNITVERGSLVPELKAMNEARLRERLQSPLGILYTDDRTGRLDKSKIAADMKMGDFGREGREAQSRTFANQIIEKLWAGEQVPPVQQFWDHEPMLDELEAAMMTTEFIEASPQIYQIFMDRWQQHVSILQAKQDAQQAAMQSQMVHQAVAQSTQQAAAQAAGEAVHEAHQQLQAQSQAKQGQDLGGMVAAASQGHRPPSGPTKSGAPRPTRFQPPRGVKPPQ